MTGTEGSAAGADRTAGEPGADGARLAEEIRLLVDLVTERAEPWLRGVFAAGHGGGDPFDCDVGAPGARTGGGAGAAEEPGDAASGAAGTSANSSCAWCPLCAVLAVVRGEAPEIAARVLEQAVQVIALLRAVLADRWQPDEGVHMPGYRPSTRPGPPPAASTGATEGTEGPAHGPAGTASSPGTAQPETSPASAGATHRPAGSGRRVQRVPVRPRERWDAGE